MKNALTGIGVMAISMVVSATAFAGKTQIIVQWDDSQAQHLMHLQTVFDDQAGKLGYESDGNDVGGGVINFYLYTDDTSVQSLIPQLVALQNQGALPLGMRIGTAVYKDAKRKNWTYRPAYPAQLKSFKQ